MNTSLVSIVQSFNIDGEIINIEPFGSGHINDTYKVTTSDGNPDFLLQRINHKVFKDVDNLMENFERVTRHIQQKLNASGESDNRKALGLVYTKNNTSYILDNAGNYWRLLYFINNARSYDVIEQAKQAFEGGKAYGRFQSLLADIPGDPLHDTLPDFHSMIFRLNNFDRALKTGNKSRIAECKQEIKFVETHRDEMLIFDQLIATNKIPLRITHNDTKFNNVLLDENNKALCVIDLDTVMNGIVHFDFGDAIRTGASTANEDEKELSKVDIDLQLFEAFATGFLNETRSFLTIEEKKYLWFAPKYMTFIMGLRFLTDYLEDDVYYKTAYNTHNLVRALNQFHLARKIEGKQTEIKAIITRILKH